MSEAKKMELGPLLSGVAKLGAMAVLVPRSQAEAVGLPSWQQSCSMVLCGVFVTPNVPGGEGDTISPFLMARQG